MNTLIVMLIKFKVKETVQNIETNCTLLILNKRCN